MYQTTCHDAGQPQVNHFCEALGAIVAVHCTPVHMSISSLKNVVTPLEFHRIAGEVGHRNPISALRGIAAFYLNAPGKLRGTRTNGQGHDGPDNMPRSRPAPGEPEAGIVRRE